jgi:hypothetical protein
MGYNKALVRHLLSLSPTVQMQPLLRYFLLYFSCATQSPGLHVDTNVLEDHIASIFMAYPEDGDGMFLRNICIHLQDYTVRTTCLISNH